MSETFTRAATARASSWKPETRTFTALATSYADVNRGSYIEGIDRSTAAPASAYVGLPVLNSHRSGDARDAVGKITAARETAEGVEVDIQLLPEGDASADAMAARVAAGVLNAVSIGYSGGLGPAVRQSDGTTRRVIRNMRPHEVSLVLNPADSAATIRSNPTEKGNLMPENVQTENRSRQILTFARSHNLSDDVTADLIERNADETEMQAAAFRAMQTTAPRIRAASGSAPANDDPRIIAERRAEAIFCRGTGATPSDACRQYLTEDIADAARYSLTRSGRSTLGMDRVAMVRAAMQTTSDFQVMTNAILNLSVAPAYQAQSSALKVLAAQKNMTDFRDGSRVQFSGVGTLKKVAEGGELKYAGRTDVVESWKLETMGLLHSVSYQALVNDPTGTLSEFASVAATAAANTEADILAAVLTSNPKLSDGKPVFSTARGNMAAAGSALSVDSIGAVRLAQRNMTGPDGTRIQVTPKYLVVGPTLETPAEKVLAQIYATTPDGVNPFSGKLTLVVEPRLTGNGWYMAADPAQVRCMEYGYLAATPGPQISSRDGWETLGVEFRVWEDFGAGMVDFRGLYFNPGAAA